MATKVNERKRNVDKPYCKYGSSCYRKNSEHRKKFKHTNENNDNENTVNLLIETKMDILEESVSDSTMTEQSEILENFQDSALIVSSNTTCCEETVDQILKSMPKDFYDFWDFCSFLKRTNPEDAFSTFGYKLVGVYDLLAKNLPKDKKIDISCHWRYFYDPPEFQTVIMKTGKKLFHIGYFRDDPSKMPTILASNYASLGAKLTPMGDNIFAAMSTELENAAKTQKSKAKILSNLQKQLHDYATRKKYSLKNQTIITKARQKKVVAKTFHGLGIVVPVKNDVGYRPLPDSNSALKLILKDIADAKSESEKLKHEEDLDEIITNVQFANDECDYGMGLEFGIDLFCFGHSYFHNHILFVLPLAYDLLQRPKYASIIRAHLKNRKKDAPLISIDL